MAEKNSNLKTRVISAICMLPLLVFLWLGGFPLLIAVNVICVLGMKELYDGFDRIGFKANRWLGYISLALYVVIVGAHFYTDHSIANFSFEFMLWFFISVSMALFCAVFDKKNDHNFYSGPLGILGCFYVGFLCNHLSLISMLPHGKKLVWLPIVIFISTDSAAYFIGRKFGKKKLAPLISPKKTMAGFYGGMAGGTLACTIFALIFAKDMILHFAVMGFIGSFFSQGGDLVASAFKRKMGLKDFSNLIPGHGGVLDRFDSTLFTSPFVFYYAIFVMGVLK